MRKTPCDNPAVSTVSGGDASSPVGAFHLVRPRRCRGAGPGAGRRPQAESAGQHIPGPGPWAGHLTRRPGTAARLGAQRGLSGSALDGFPTFSPIGLAGHAGASGVVPVLFRFQIVS